VRKAVERVRAACGGESTGSSDYYLMAPPSDVARYESSSQWQDSRPIVVRSTVCAGGDGQEVESANRREG
jgi:hypothetical protein